MNFYYIQEAAEAANMIQCGKTICYPTSGVYGLGCDVQNESALTKLLALKKRDTHKGLIILSAHADMIKKYIDFTQIDNNIWQKILYSWSQQHITWIFPATKLVNKYIHGGKKTVAIRISRHPFIQELFKYLHEPIVSTSANVSRETPMPCLEKIRAIFGNKISLYVQEKNLLKIQQVSEIRDALTNKILRSAKVITDN